MNNTIVVCGKGGVGKTTLSALLANTFRDRRNTRTLLVDADHAGGLGVALDIQAPTTLNDIRKQSLQEWKQGASSKKTDLEQSIDYFLFAALEEREHLAFIALGRPEEKGCFCSVNSLLKRALGVLADQFDTVIIDAEAGIEQVNRDVTGRVDHHLLVADTSVKALRVAQTIKQVALEYNDQSAVSLVINRVQDEAQLDRAREQTNLPILGWIPEDPLVQTFDSQARSFFTLPNCPAQVHMRKLVERLSL